MMDRAEFLLARIAEDEQIARAAVEFDYGVTKWCDGGDPDWVHIARWDPARVLAECEARRQIVTTQQSLASFDRYPDVDYTGLDAELSRLDWVCHLLALLYADHPDYDEEW